MLTLKHILAARTIQRVFRGSRARAKLPQLRKFQAANLNAGQHLDVVSLNNFDEFWSVPATKHPPQPMTPPPSWLTEKPVFFNRYELCRDENGDHHRPAIVLDHSETIRGRFAQMINAQVSGKPVYPYIEGLDMDGINSLGEYFKSAIQSLEAGEKVQVWDGYGTSIKPVVGMNSLKSCYIKFRFFADFEKTYVPLEDIQNSHGFIENSQPSLARVAPRTICGVPRVDVAAPMNDVPSLARVAPRTICGVPRVDQAAEDDLEERFQKLLNLR
jgi:hypothetical protein